MLEYKFMLNSKSQSSVLWYNQMEKKTNGLSLTNICLN